MVRIPLSKRIGFFAAAGLVAAAAAVTFALVARQQSPSYTITSTPTPLYEIKGPRGAKLKGPLGLAIHRNRLYVADSGNSRILVFTLEGRLLSRLGESKSGRLLGYPVAVAVSERGEIYSADAKGGRVGVLSPRGELLRTLRPPKGGWRPLGLAFDERGRLYVSDGDGGQVAVYEDGERLRETLAKGRMSYPNGLTLDEAGDLYVADSNNGRILVFSGEDRVRRTLPVGNVAAGVRTLLLPRGIAVDAKGRVYVTDTLANVVHISERRGKILAGFGTESRSFGALNFPNGIVLDGQGRIFIADKGNNRVVVWGYK